MKGSSMRTTVMQLKQALQALGGSEPSLNADSPAAEHPLIRSTPPSG